MAKELKRRGFKFVGPTTAYALMQACGLVNDHLEGLCRARLKFRAARRRRCARPAAERWLADVELPPERPDRPFVIGTFVVPRSTDGRRSMGSTKHARHPLPISRCCWSCAALADAVLVGPRDDPRRGLRTTGAAARSAEIPFFSPPPPPPQKARTARARGPSWRPSRLFVEGVLARRRPGPRRDEVWLDGHDLPGALAGLRTPRVRSVLCEGGPRLLGSLLSEGLVDELFLTLAPTLTGEPGAPRSFEGGSLARARPGRAAPGCFAHDGELFLRYSVGSPA